MNLRSLSYAPKFKKIREDNNNIISLKIELSEFNNLTNTQSSPTVIKMRLLFLIVLPVLLAIMFAGLFEMTGEDLRLSNFKRHPLGIAKDPLTAHGNGSIFDKFPVIRLDPSSKYSKPNICEPVGVINTEPGCLMLPADLSKNLYRVLAIQEWKVLVVKRACYFHNFIRQYDTDSWTIGATDLTREMCQKTDTPQADHYNVREAHCAFFTGEEFRSYMKTDVSHSEGQLVFINNSHYIHSLRSNVRVEALTQGTFLRQIEDNCVKYEITLEGINVDVERYEDGFILQGVKFRFLESMTIEGRQCWLTSGLFLACECDGVIDNTVSMFDTAALTVALQQEHTERHAKEISAFCEQCEVENHISFELKLMCNKHFIFKYHLDWATLTISYEKGYFKSHQLTFDPRLGTMVPAEFEIDIPRFEYPPRYLYLNYGSYLLNCSVIRKNYTVSSTECGRIDLSTDVRFSHFVTDYTVSSFLFPKIKQRIDSLSERTGEVLSSVSIKFPNLKKVWDWISLKIPTWFWVGCLIIVAITFTLICYPRSRIIYTPVMRGPRGGTIELDPI